MTLVSLLEPSFPSHGWTALIAFSVAGIIGLGFFIAVRRSVDSALDDFEVPLSQMQALDVARRVVGELRYSCCEESADGSSVRGLTPMGLSYGQIVTLTIRGRRDDNSDVQVLSEIGRPRYLCTARKHQRNMRDVRERFEMA